MFLLNSCRGQHTLIDSTLTTPASTGLNLRFTHFEGHSPWLSGWTRVVKSTVDSSTATASTPYSDASPPPYSETKSDSPTTNIAVRDSDDIKVKIAVKSTEPSYINNVRISQEKNHITISTGGLSILSYATSPRLTIEVTIILPPAIGNLEINSISLPVIVEEIEKANDIVIKTISAPISINTIETAHSLTTTTISGSTTFVQNSTQTTSTTIKTTSQSGSTTISSTTLTAPDSISISGHSGSTQLPRTPTLKTHSLSLSAHSGSLSFSLATTATDLSIKNSSGSINGTLQYLDKASGASKSSFANHSGSTNVGLEEWSGFAEARNHSGSTNFVGFEREGGGWRKGDGDSVASFVSQSGSIFVRAL